LSIILFFSTFFQLSGQLQSFQIKGNDLAEEFGFEVKSSLDGFYIAVSHHEAGELIVTLYRKTTNSSLEYEFFDTVIFNQDDFSGDFTTTSIDISGNGNFIFIVFESTMNPDYLVCNKMEILSSEIVLINSHTIIDFNKVSFSNNDLIIESNNFGTTVAISYYSENSVISYALFDTTNEPWSRQNITTGGSILSNGNHIDYAKEEEFVVVSRATESTQIGGDRLMFYSKNEDGEFDLIADIIEPDYFRDISISPDAKYVSTLENRLVNDVFQDTMDLNIYIYENNELNKFHSDGIRFSYPVSRFHSYVKISNDGAIVVCGASRLVGDQGEEESIVLIYKMKSGTYEQVNIINTTTRFNTLDLSSDGSLLFVGESNFSDDCGMITVYDLSEIVASNKDLSELGSFELFPNPVSDVLFIKSSVNLQNVNFKIFNYLGQEVKRGVFEEKDKIDVRSMANGLYYFKVAEKISHSTPFVVRH